ncbi:MAG TPA: 3'(2'),5'-bisphosphate nucleotidase CysQ [Myxococcales bacterium]|nr:3'(2'),5'-bisphosphate nucleotidase CysQ [Myxococcales bacterium]HIN84893.1 3'(2'),5'-bisphosphate nucleotidase CysQ [Myxococcales bacterium]
MIFEHELKVALAAAKEAADAICEFNGTETEIQYKNPIEPVTEADMVADRILSAALLGAFPDYGWLSEESIDSPARLSKDYVWVVDPLDGTREFIAGRPEYCVSVGLVVKEEPVLGVIVNPATGHCFSAVIGAGSTLDGEPIHVSKTVDSATGVTLVSRSESRRNLLTRFDSILTLEPMGGMSHKLCLVAAGHAAATFTRFPRNEWDVAAGIVILQEAGGVMTRLDGSPLRFNQSSPEIVGMAASNNGSHQELLDLVNSV